MEIIERMKLNKRLREIAQREFEISDILANEYNIDNDEIVDLVKNDPKSYQRLLELSTELIDLSVEQASINHDMELYSFEGLILMNLKVMTDSLKVMLEANRKVLTENES